jgi:hypothetical protein
VKQTGLRQSHAFVPCRLPPAEYLQYSLQAFSPLTRAVSFLTRESGGAAR